jgi:IS5 family transposase
MQQQTFATMTGFEKHSRKTRKEAFLSRMEVLRAVVGVLCAAREPYYPKAGKGRQPVGLERMLRMYFLANWFNLADEACEEALYDVPLFRDFCRIDLGHDWAPDATVAFRLVMILYNDWSNEQFRVLSIP